MPASGSIPRVPQNVGFLSGGKKQYGEKLYDALLLMNTHAAQHELLRRRELRPVDIGTLYGPAPSRKRNDELFRSLREISAANVRLVTELGVACADLGPPATQPGDSEMLKQKERVQFIFLVFLPVFQLLLIDRRFEFNSASA